MNHNTRICSAMQIQCGYLVCSVTFTCDISLQSTGSSRDNPIVVLDSPLKKLAPHKLRKSPLVNSTVCVDLINDGVANIPAVACMNPSEKGEGLVRAGITLCRKSVYFLPGLEPRHIHCG